VASAVRSPRLPFAPLAFVALASITWAVATLSGCKDSSGSSDAPVVPSAAASAEIKDVALPGVDTSAMTPRERHEFSALVTQLFAPCPSVPVSLATCVLDKRACGQCAQASKFVARAVRSGASEADVERVYKSRFDPAGIKTLPLAGSPARGPEGAPVTVVEFADFECPHCRAAVPMIDAVMAAHPDQIRLVYKFVVLSMHVHAEAAARSAWAAGQQGKFWEMEHLLFERQDHLEQADLERYAQILKLDVNQWKSDMESAGAKDRLAQDKKLEDDLKLVGTPTIYVNGRELDTEAEESLEERVAAELGVPPAGVPSASPSSSGSSAPAPSASTAAVASARPR
jgi:protein-disulfide isomerase